LRPTTSLAIGSASATPADEDKPVIPLVDGLASA
jgi:hypothetical protein